MRLGQLAGHAGPAGGAEDGGEIGQRGRRRAGEIRTTRACRGGTAALSNRRRRAPDLRGGKPRKRKRSVGRPAPTSAASSGRGAGDRDDARADGDGGRHHPVAGIGDERRAGLGDERDRGARGQAVGDLGRARRLVGVEAGEDRAVRAAPISARRRRALRVSSATIRSAVRSVSAARGDRSRGVAERRGDDRQRPRPVHGHAGTLGGFPDPPATDSAGRARLRPRVRP